MKVIIAGSRHLRQYRLVGAAVASSGWTVSEVISGGASGIDQLAIRWAREHEVPITVMPADWRRWGPAAGPIRNRLMAERADALIAVWDGFSRGTASMICLAERRGLPVHVCRTDLPRPTPAVLAEEFLAGGPSPARFHQLMIWAAAA